MVFKKGVHPKLQDRFMRIIHEGNSLTLVQDFVVSLQERELERYAKVNMIKEFIKRPTYYLIKDNVAHILKLKKKSILALLDNDKQLVAYIKKHVLKLKSEKDLVQLLQFYDEEKRGASGLGAEK